MRTGRPARRFAACTAVSLALAGLTLPAAYAQTTPAPIPVDPEQPPASEPPPFPVPGPIVADAGTGLGIVRILPNTIPNDSIFEDSEYDDQLPKQSLLEVGLGLAVARANSSAYLGQERSVAESSPFGFAVGGSSPALPGTLSQTALPDHEVPSTEALTTPGSPSDRFVELGLLEGSAHARWDRQLGPCVDPIADTKTSLASVSAINALPAMPDQKSEQLNTPAPLSQLGGLLNGKEPAADGNGSLLSVPDTISARSTIRLVDVPGQEGKAVRSTSQMQLASIQLLAGTPQELRIDVVSAPTLTATSTGDAETSSLDYTAPVLRVSQGGEELGVLDIANPQLDIPIDMPTAPEAPEMPVIGELGDGALNLGVLRLSIGELQDQSEGTEVQGLARLFNLKLLSGEAIGIPTSLAEVSFGEQAVKAGAPEGGVHCDQPDAAAPVVPAGNEPAKDVPARNETTPDVPTLALTSGAYSAVPLFWTGAGLLLIGSVLVAALPRRQ